MNQKGGELIQLSLPYAHQCPAHPPRNLPLSLSRTCKSVKQFFLTNICTRRLLIVSESNRCSTMEAEALTGRRITNQRSQYRGKSIGWQKRSTVPWQSKKWIFFPGESSRILRRFEVSADPFWCLHSAGVVVLTSGLVTERGEEKIGIIFFNRGNFSLVF